MDITLKLFLVGFGVGLIIALAPLPGEIETVADPEKYMKQIFSGGITIWKAVYFTLLLILLPIVAIEPLKKRLTMKQLLPFPFIVGNSTAIGSVTLITLLSTLF